LFCWGNNAYGQLGDGTSNGCRNKATSNTEVYPEGSTTNPAYWVFVSSGANFSCAIDIDNKLQCWGDNSQGQLGVENIASANTPRQVDSADDYFTASAGTTHACAINFTGQLKCWGSNEFGQVGNASQTLQATPDLITLPSSFSSDAWTYIDTGSHHSCGIIDDQFELSLWCWGSQRHGQLGISDPTDQALPVRVDKNLQWSVVSAGTDHSCGITTDGQLYCWGSNAYGKLGHGEGTIWYSSPAEFQ
jgi:alpha-tubulin suppressor-like RCC1 family protein